MTPPETRSGAANAHQTFQHRQRSTIGRGYSPRFDAMTDLDERYDEHPAEADWYAGFERDPFDECVADRTGREAPQAELLEAA